MTTANTVSAPPHGDLDVGEKYSKLKRRYYDLETQHQQALEDLRRSGERNSKLYDERQLLLDRIVELEAIVPPHSLSPGALNHMQSALPRKLIHSAQEKASFEAGMRTALAEVRHPASKYAAGAQYSLGQISRGRTTAVKDPALESRWAKRQREPSEVSERPPEEATTGTAGRPRGGKRARGGSKEVVGPGGENRESLRIHIRPPASASDAARPSNDAHSIRSPTSRTSGHPEEEEEVTLLQAPPYQSRSAGGSNSSSVTSPPPSTSTAPNAAASNTRKPKRLKAHTVRIKTIHIPTVPRDETGRPLLPLNVGVMTVFSLGEICLKEHYHTERYVFPIGYTVTRRYFSASDPDGDTVYNCSIRSGDEGPVFRIEAPDLEHGFIESGTSTGAWAIIVRKVNKARGRTHSNSVSGPDFYGLTQNTIKSLIQDLPNAEKLSNYIRQNFVESGNSPLGGRHAAIVPLLDRRSEGRSSPSETASNGQRPPPEVQDVPMSDVTDPRPPPDDRIDVDDRSTATPSQPTPTSSNGNVPARMAHLLA